MLTDLFFTLSIIISMFFFVCLIVLFVLYSYVYNKVNRSFKVVREDD